MSHCGCIGGGSHSDENILSLGEIFLLLYNEIDESYVAVCECTHACVLYVCVCVCLSVLPGSESVH